MNKALILIGILVLASLPVLGITAGQGASITAVPSFTHYAGPSSLAYTNAAGEPSVGVNWNTNAVMYQAYAGTFRVTFNTASPPVATWTNVRPVTSVFNVDPILATDHVTGRTFAGGLDGSCSVMSFSDNDGASWTPMGNVCAGAAFDHPTIGSGPWAPSATPHLYSRAVYYCAQLSAVQCAVSNDGGLTFGPGAPVTCASVGPGLHGSVHVGPNGWAYLPFSWCGGSIGIGITKNNGVTWNAAQIPGAGTPAAGFDPDVATTPDGTAWVAYPTTGYGVGVARTANGGASWTNFGDVAAAAGVRSSTFHEMIAGDNGRVAVAYLGSTTDGNPHISNFTGTWYVYVTYSLDNGATWNTVQASTNKIQKGWICSDGTGCSAGRNLLDFIDAQVDADGRMVIAVADGCINTCETGTGASNSEWATIIRQSGGDDLIAP